MVGPRAFARACGLAGRVLSAMAPESFPFQGAVPRALCTAPLYRIATESANPTRERPAAALYVPSTRLLSGASTCRAAHPDRPGDLGYSEGLSWLVRVSALLHPGATRECGDVLEDHRHHSLGEQQAERHGVAQRSLSFRLQPTLHVAMAPRLSGCLGWGCAWSPLDWTVSCAPGSRPTQRSVQRSSGHAQRDEGCSRAPTAVIVPKWPVPAARQPRK